MGGVFMTDLMQAIYKHIEENCFREYLPREYYWHYQRVLEAADEALHNSLSEEQWDLFETYMDTKITCYAMEQEALFQAVFAAARELS